WIGALRFEAGTAVEEEARDLGAAVGGGLQEWIIPSIRVRATIEEQLCDGGAVPADGGGERCLLVAAIHRSAGLQQQPDHGDLPRVGGGVEGRAPVPVGRVHVS